MDNSQLPAEREFHYRIHYDPASGYYFDPANPLRIFIL